jgi:DNA (cytosine-5)-methyltransferase 1
MIRLGSLFDGIGGFLLAASRHGITPVWASEIEPFPIEVTKHHFPGLLHVGDISKLDGAKLPPVERIAGGSPCQDSVWPDAERVSRVSVPAYSWNKFAS